MPVKSARLLQMNLTCAVCADSEGTDGGLVGELFRNVGNKNRGRSWVLRCGSVTWRRGFPKKCTVRG